jgi:hypothetical protein
MDTGAKVILSLYAFGAVVVIILLIYLIDKRIKDRDKEDFEKRDN